LTAQLYAAWIIIAYPFCRHGHRRPHPARYSVVGLECEVTAARKPDLFYVSRISLPATALSMICSTKQLGSLLSPPMVSTQKGTRRMWCSRAGVRVQCIYDGVVASGDLAAIV